MFLVGFCCVFVMLTLGMWPFGLIEWGAMSDQPRPWLCGCGMINFMFIFHLFDDCMAGPGRPWSRTGRVPDLWLQCRFDGCV